MPPTVKRFTEPRRANLSKFANHHCKLHRIWKRFILVLFRFHSFLREQKIKDFRPVSTYSTSQLVDVVTPGPTAISFPAWAIGAAVAGGGVLLLAIGVALLMLALRSKRLNSSPLSPSSSALHDDAPDMVSARMSSAIYDAPPVDFLQYGSAPPLSQDSMYDSPDVALKR